MAATDIPIKLTDDDVFAWCFGRNEQKEALIELINAVFTDSGFEQIVNAKIVNPFSIRRYKSDKKAIFDIPAEDEKERKIQIEMQAWDDSDFVARIFFYWSKNFSRQAQKSERYTLLRPVVVICFVTRPLFIETKKQHNCFLIKEQNDKNLVLSDHLRIHFIEMNKKNALKPGKILNSWVEYLLYEGKKDMTYLTKSYPGIGIAHRAFEEFRKDSKLKKYHWARWESKRTLENALFDAQQKGIEKGVRKKAMDTACKIRAAGLSPKQIAEFTGLSTEQVEELNCDL